VTVSDKQVRKLANEFAKTGKIYKSALKANMDRKTAKKYIKAGKLPSEMRQERTWRTREDPFIDIWDEVVSLLKQTPELEAKFIFEYYQAKYPDKFEPGQLRTFQRRVKQWRAEFGPDKEVFFTQMHRPGEAIQTDFTDGRSLEITINGEVLSHQICHSVLPYSNYEWVTVCGSESFLGLKRELQSFLFLLGRTPVYHQTDNTTAVSHQAENGDRIFNDDYKQLMTHFGIKPRTIQIGKKEQNGDIESLHGAFKRRVKQHLLLGNGRDFTSVEAYEQFLQDIAQKANRLRETKFTEELEAMLPLRTSRLPNYKIEEVRVSSCSTIRVKGCVYSVPSRLKGEMVRVYVYEDKLKIYFGSRYQFSVARLLGYKRHHINYRHIIWSLVKKPGAFERYKYRDDMFPTDRFRWAYDRLEMQTDNRQANINYTKILHLAACTMETEVDTALELLQESKIIPRFDIVKNLLEPIKNQAPVIAEFKPDLSEYDLLLEHKREITV